MRLTIFPGSGARNCPKYLPKNHLKDVMREMKDPLPKKKEDGAMYFSQK